MAARVPPMVELLQFRVEIGRVLAHLVGFLEERFRRHGKELGLVSRTVLSEYLACPAAPASERQGVSGQHLGPGAIVGAGA